MAPEYDSDSSTDDVETGVTLGYASEDTTGDDFSHLGGHPSWLDEQNAPPGAFAKCKTCNGLMNLLLQLNGDLPDRFPGHDRRLYIFACRRKACRRKNGSIRGIRSSTRNPSMAKSATKKSTASNETESVDALPPAPVANLGDTLFGNKVTAGSTSGLNPFASSASSAQSKNPFARPTPAGQPAEPIEPVQPAQVASKQDDLSQTFAHKARIAAHASPSLAKTHGLVEPWPKQADFPAPYPPYYIDADKEFLESEPQPTTHSAQIVEVDAEGDASGGSGGAMDVKDAFESSMDKTFQRFADRMSQNSEQVLRYEFGAQPLLYSKTDPVGKTWPRVARCSKCGGERVFELQLTPHAIAELEAGDVSLEGMDWGTIILAVCSKDCEGWSEEWIGVQWEELAGKRAA